MAIFNSILNRLLNNREQKIAAEILANITKDEVGIPTAQAGTPKVHVVKLNMPAQAGQKSPVFFAELGINPDTDFICPLLDEGNGYVSILPWQIVSLKTLSDMGEFVAEYTYRNNKRNLFISILAEMEGGDSPDDPEERVLYVGVTLWWAEWMA